MTKKILILPGDGIGQEVTASAKEVLDFLIAEHNLILVLKKWMQVEQLMISLDHPCQKKF